MSGGSRPPRLAEQLLSWSLPRDRFDDISGDLDEVFARIRAEEGPLLASLWYWREALMLSGRFVLERGRERRQRKRREAGRRRTEAGRVRSAAGRAPAGARSLNPFRVFAVSPIDVRLGVRMLLKNPGLTIVSTLALAIAIAIIAGFTTATQFMVSPQLPVPDGDEVVAIWQHDTLSNDRGTQTLGDMLVWADELETLDGVGAFRLQERGITVNGATRLVRAAEMTPSVFRLLRIPPALGRPLVDADTQPGAADVAVIGYDLWQTVLAADPAIVGKTVRIGGVPHTVVGVMPEDFGLPQSESIWTPLRIDSASLRPDQGPAIDFTIARLAPSVSLDEVDAELQVAAARLAVEYPDTHGGLRPRVTPYALSFIESDEPGLRLLMQAARLAVGVILLIVAVNIGALIYARNAARMGEIAVRMALGASRRRIVLQMFIEALVLAVLAAVVGVAILLWPLGRFQAVFDTAIAQGDGLPVWFDVGLGWHTMLTVMALTLLSAVLTGALPALKLTSRRVQAQLQRSQPGSSGLTFGRTTTLIVVSQVALSVALLTVGGAQLRSIVDDWSFGDDGGRSREQLLRADLRWDLGPDGEARNDTRALLARAEARREFARRAETELDVAGATFESFQGIRYFSPDTGAAAGALLPFTYTTAVESNYFDVQGVPLRAGRALAAGDWLDTAAPVAVVNHAFVDAMSLDGDPVGRHIRQIDPRTRQASGDSIRIVGVAEDIRALEVSQQGPSWIARPTVYLPLSDTAAFVRTVIRARGDPGRLAGSLQALAADIDPTLLVHRVRTFVDDDRFALTMAGLYGIAVGFFVFAALLLSTTGVYAMMSFTATQRTREIGIRTALGAPAARIVGAIFARAMTQLGLGTIIGLGIGYLAADGPFALSRGLFTDGPGVALGVAALIIAMGLVACGRPMRRALSIEPTVALRADG